MNQQSQKTYDYIIVGGGMTAAAAAQGIREVDAQGSIAIISAENHRPYNRPPLTKKLWQGKSEDSIGRELPQEGTAFIPGCRVAALDAQQKTLHDEQGQPYAYRRLLLATGGTPRRLPFGPNDMLYYRTIDDYHTARSWTGKSARIGIIGGGFIGTEIAASLAALGEKAVLVFPENSLGGRIYPADLSAYLTDYYRQKGVELHPNLKVEAVEGSGSGWILRGKDGRQVQVDHIIAGVGIQPNVELAQAAGASIAAPETGGGILVDENLRTNLPDVYAAGDVASFFNPTLQRRMRVEHEDNALSMGRAAGQNMAGQASPYHHQPYFYSDLFDLGYEAVGELDSRLEIFADWVEPYRQGVVYYLKDNTVRGVLLWNTWDQVDAARALIAEGRSYRQGELKGCLPRP